MPPNYRLRASGAGGVSAESDAHGATTLPAAPSGLTATVTTSLFTGTETIELEWIDGSAGESGFRVEASANGGPAYEVANANASTGSSGAVSVQVTGLAAETTYRFTVYAYNDGGDSAPSNTATGQTNGWLTTGDAEVAVSGSSRVVTIAEATSEGATQTPGVSGAALLLAPAASYTVSFTPSLYTWDSYTDPGPDPQNPTPGQGYWDSFSVSLAESPYWTRTDLAQDPLNLPFIWGGGSYDPEATGTGLESHFVARTLTLASPDPDKAQYLSVVLDTNTSAGVDSAYPSWGTFAITTNPLPVMPRVNVAPTKDRSQAAEGGTEAAQGEFTIWREGGSIAEDLLVKYTVATGQGQATPDGAPGADYRKLSGTAIIPAGAHEVKVRVEAYDDGLTGEGTEPVTITLEETAEPKRYQLGRNTTATVNILDRAKYVVYYYGTDGLDNFGDQWLDLLGDVTGAT